MSEALVQLLDAWHAQARPRARMPCHRDPHLWFSERPAELERAKALCRTCALRAPCLRGALERREPHGVWGGEIVQNGVVVASKRPRGRPRKRAIH